MSSKYSLNILMFVLYISSFFTLTLTSHIKLLSVLKLYISQIQGIWSSSCLRDKNCIDGENRPCHLKRFSSDTKTPNAINHKSMNTRQFPNSSSLTMSGQREHEKKFRVNHKPNKIWYMDSLPLHIWTFSP